MKIITKLIIVVLAIISVLSINTLIYLNSDNYTYKKGKELYKEKKYEEVIKLFKNFDYKESKTYVEKSIIKQSEIISKENISEAIKYIEKCKSNKCTSKKIEYMFLEVLYYSEKDSNKTLELLSRIDPYIDDVEEYNDIIYNMAVNNMEDNNRYLEVVNLLSKIEDYKDSKELISNLKEKHKYDGTWKSTNLKNETRYFIFNGEDCYVSNSKKDKYIKYKTSYKTNEIKILDNKKEIYKITIDYGVMSYKWNNKTVNDEKYKWLMSMINDEYTFIGTKYEPEIGMTKKEIENSILNKPNKITRKDYKIGTYEIYEYDTKNLILLDNIIVGIIENKNVE